MIGISYKKDRLLQFLFALHMQTQFWMLLDALNLNEPRFDDHLKTTAINH